MIAAILGVSMSAGGRCEERLAILHTKEYAAFEFSPDVADDVVKVVGAFEKDHRRGQIGPIADEAFEAQNTSRRKRPARQTRRLSRRAAIVTALALFGPVTYETTPSG